MLLMRRNSQERNADYTDKWISLALPFSVKVDLSSRVARTHANLSDTFGFARF